MCDDCHEGDEMGDEENIVDGPVSPPNLADWLLVAWMVPEGVIAGLGALSQRVHGLLILQSSHLDEVRERKRAAKDMERAIGKF